MDTITTTAPAAAERGAFDLSRRDLPVDLARVFAVLVVVVVHLLMIGVGMKHGALVITQPLQQQPWYVPATWFGQVMPLFFALGGFATYTSYRRREPAPAAFIRDRILRLARPALPAFALFALVGWGADALGVDPKLMGAVLGGVGTPLWFFAAYLLCQASAPLMVRLHRSRPFLTLAALAAGAALVDAARHLTHTTAVGWLNLAFVWLFVQQIGFLYADGFFARRGRAATLGIFAGAVALFAALVATHTYNADMLYNLNPATVPLMLLGVAQLTLLVLLHPLLDRVMRLRAAQLAVFLLGRRLMSIYTWHLTCLLLVTGACLLIPGGLPQPGSSAWWESRPLVLVSTFALILLISLWSVRFEAVPPIAAGRRAPDPASVLTAAVILFVPTYAIAVWGLDKWLALAGLVAVASAILLTGRPGYERARSAAS
jgi:peptidoglycan/LPS O-acetylase OafA/YrhL